MRKINKAGIDLIKSFEGLSLKPYICPAGKPTIGYGTIMYPDGRSVSMQDKPITEDQAQQYLEWEVNQKASSIEKLVKINISDNEFAALTAFAYNVGLGALGGSTLLKMLNSNSDKMQVADQFLRWNKAGGKEISGLTRRRQAERSLFLQPDASSLTSSQQDASSEDIEVKLKEIEDKVLKPKIS